LFCFVAQGDAGSPIAIIDNDGEKTLIGVAIWGSLQECSFRFPAVATKIHTFLDWISVNGGPSIRP
jgi:secreted trypsin-like serine protease